MERSKTNWSIDEDLLLAIIDKTKEPDLSGTDIANRLLRNALDMHPESK